MGEEKIRESVIAGTWYPDHPETLRREIRRYLERATVPAVEGELIGLVVPHAGYMYSGGVAAFAYKMLEDRPYDRLLILAPSHRVYFHGASIYHSGGFRTPLGLVPLDHEIVDVLLQDREIINPDPRPHAQEHSLEIQLPFLQVVLKEFRLTPILMGDQSFQFCRELANSVAKACRGKRVLLVASSDLSHYHPYDKAKDLDRTVQNCIAAFDPEGLSQNLNEGKCEACGGGPIMTLMLAAQKLGANKAKVLHYANSGDVTNDRQGVVGYMAAAFFKNPVPTRDYERNERVGIDLGLSREEKEALRWLAYETIRSRCLGRSAPEIPFMTAKLKEQRGAFVCIHKGGDLRGCIGMIEGKTPLHETVKNMAIQAAFADPRFCALELDEIDQIHVEISVLTPLERIDGPSQIEIGKHGLYLRKGYYSGLLLPQVATEHAWNPEQFLEWTCRKAGLPPDAWKEADIGMYVFSADVF